MQSRPGDADDGAPSRRPRIEVQRTPGAELAVQWFGDPRGSRAVFVFMPALGVEAKYYAELGRRLAEIGYAIAMVPFRGERASVAETRRTAYGYRDILEVDLPHVLEGARAAASGAPLLLAGHSLGGQLALLSASRRPDGVRGVVLLAGGSNYYASLPPRQRLSRGVGVRFVRLTNQVLGFFPGDKLGFGGRQPKKLMMDWSHEAVRGRYRIEGDARDPEGDLAALRLPVLFVCLSGDRLVPRASAEYLASKLKQAPVQIEELEPGVFRGKVDHFRWARDPGPMVTVVDRWAQGILAS